MPYLVNGFDWHAGNATKCRQYGVMLTDIEALFGGEVSVFPDVTHSNAETRFLAIGRTPPEGMYLLHSPFASRQAVV